MKYPNWNSIEVIQGHAGGGVGIRRALGRFDDLLEFMLDPVGTEGKLQHEALQGCPHDRHLQHLQVHVPAASANLSLGFQKLGSGNYHEGHTF